MAANDSPTVLIGNFADSKEAERFVQELKRAGFRDDQIGVLARHEEGETQVEEGAAAGALTGGVWGVLLGAAVAIGLAPGIGPVIAGGLLAGVVGGAAVGGAIGVAAGGLLGALVGLGVPEEEARQYECEFLAGRTLVVVKGNGKLGLAATIYRRVQEETAALAAGSPKLAVEELPQRP